MNFGKIGAINNCANVLDDAKRNVPLTFLNGNVATTVSMVEIDLTAAHFKGLSLHVVFMLIPMLHNHRREEHARLLKALSEIVEAGALKPVLDETEYQLAEIGKAHERLESGQAMGKVVVTV
ncbi:zinc-binding dehydrogenase [Alteromonas sp. W364]|uniref:zinc-binding dehydrogenase n=1 Tax=Alteromonas sp. W364 TaxID=3075610 RepID=UPI003904CED7